MTDTEDKPILFGPVNGKSLKREYKELAANKAFDGLSSDEFLFVWYMGNKSSPIDHKWNDSVRAKQAAWQCFPTGSEKRNAYASMDFPHEIKAAIEEMEKYSPVARMVALRMTQEMFHNLQKMIQFNEDDFKKVDEKTKKTEIDWTAKRQYVDIVSKASETIPVLLKQLEEGFGIKETQKKSEESGIKPIDAFHQHKKERK